MQPQPESRVEETETEDDSKSGKIHLLKSLRVGAIGPEAGVGVGAGVGTGEHKSLNDMRQNVQVTIQPAARLIREDLFLQARPGKARTQRGLKIDYRRSTIDG